MCNNVGKITRKVKESMTKAKSNNKKKNKSNYLPLLFRKRVLLSRSPISYTIYVVINIRSKQNY